MNSEQVRRHPHWLPALVMIVVIAAAVWLPVGLRKIAQTDEWVFYSYYDQGLTIFHAAPNLPNRFTVLWLSGLGYFLSPDHFISLNVLQASLYLLEGCAFYAVARMLLPGGLAAGAAALFMLFPADRGMFALVLINYHLLNLALLLAVLCLLKYRRRPRVRVLVIMWLMQTLAVGISESGIPVLLMTPLLLVWQNRGFDRHLLRPALLWYVVLLPLLAYGGLALLSAPTSYQGSLVALAGIDTYVSALGRFYERGFWGAWREIQPNWRDLPLAGLVGAVVAGISWLEWRGRLSRRTLAMILLGGLALFGLSLLVFLPTRARQIDLRVFYLAATGGAVTLAALAALPRSRRVFALLAGLAAGWACFGLIAQHRGFARQSDEQKRILASVIHTLPAPPEQPALILLFDSANRIAFDNLFNARTSSRYITSALNLLYKSDSVQAYLCSPEDTFRNQAFDRCQLTPDNVVIHRLNQPPLETGYENVIAFQYLPGAGVERMPPDELAERYGLGRLPPVRDGLIPAHPATTRRIEILLAEVPPPLFDATPRDRMRFDFDRDVPGFGWYPPENGGSAAWMGGRLAAVDVYLLPGQDYRLRFRVAFALRLELVRQLVVRVNGQPMGVSFDPQPDGSATYSTVIRADRLPEEGERTRITFAVPAAPSPDSLGISPDRRRLALLFDWLEISPS